METIDHLRRRKARPDLARICHVVRRRFGLNPADTEAKLEKLVDSEVVIKVDYKGNVSYRNAAKWRKSMLGCGVLNSTSISTKILEAILEISKATDCYVAAHIKPESESGITNNSNNNNNNVINNNNNNNNNEISGANASSAPPTTQNSQNGVKSAAEIGVPLESINVWLKINCDGFASLRSPLTVILKREIDAGRVRRLANGNYVISQTQMTAISSGVIRPLKNVKKAPEVGSSSANTSASSTTPATTANGGANTAVKVGTPPEPTSSRAASPGAQGSGPTVIPARRGRPPKHRPGLVAGATPSSCAAGTSAASATQQQPNRQGEDTSSLSPLATSAQSNSNSKVGKSVPFVLIF